MAELSPTNAALEVKLDYIQRDISVIKTDIKEIKNDYVSRREFDNKITEVQNSFNERMTEITDKVTLLNKVLYGIVGLLGTTAIISLFKLIIK